jgi:hypothetical protein
MLLPKRFVPFVLASCAAAFVSVSCAGSAAKPTPPLGPQPAKPDLVVTSASLTITGSLPTRGASKCEVEVVIKNQGKAPVEAAAGPFIVSAALRVTNPPSDAYVPATLTSFESYMGGPGHPKPLPVELVASGPIGVGQSRILKATGVIMTRGYSGLELVVTVDDCQTGKPPCKIDESDETNNVFAVALGNIGKAP